MQDLSDLPFGSEYNPPERIVCAANRYGHFILAGVRHCDGVMSNVDQLMDHLGVYLDEMCGKEEQGFLTSKHRFVDRYEAWKIATEQNQIVRLVGGNNKNGGCLYSENLY